MRQFGVVPGSDRDFRRADGGDDGRGSADPDSAGQGAGRIFGASGRIVVWDLAGERVRVCGKRALLRSLVPEKDQQKTRKGLDFTGIGRICVCAGVMHVSL